MHLSSNTTNGIHASFAASARAIVANTPSLWAKQILPDSIKSRFRRFVEPGNEKEVTSTEAAVAKTKRKLEFAIGRECAGGLLATWKERSPIGVAEDRSPIWPAGFVGSISHSQDWVWAAVAQSSQIPSLGIDTERVVTAKTAGKLEDVIATKAEWNLTQRLKLDHETVFTIVFSAKESFYKCWYPVTKKYFGFEHVVVVACGPNRIQIGLCESNPNFGSRPNVLDVFFFTHEGSVFTATWMCNPE